MKINVVTPAARRSRSGNRVTEVRWARLLRQLDHHVRIEEEFRTGAADVLIAIHAFRSAEAIDESRRVYPERPIVLLLAGTDIYRFQHSNPGRTPASMRTADRLVGLHDSVAEDIPECFRAKLQVIFQSADRLSSERQPSQRSFDVCVVGHLREEKDPLRAALAARALPANSKLRILHLGKAHNDEWARAARTEMESNPRYRWRGEVPHSEVRRCFARCHAMVVSSVMEGGANVVRKRW